jgi:hypothetical protein
MPAMFLAGLPVRDDLILELARLVDDPQLADRLERAYGDRIRILALDIAERETIIRALEDPPAGLEELRATLVQEHAGACATASSSATNFPTLGSPFPIGGARCTLSS